MFKKPEMRVLMSAALLSLSLLLVIGCSDRSPLSDQPRTDAPVASGARSPDTESPRLIAPKRAKKRLQDQTSRPWGEMPSATEGPRLFEMVSAAEIVFMGTVTELSEPAYLIDYDHPTWDSVAYQDVTFDVQAYYRDELRAGPRVGMKIMTYGAEVPVLLLEERWREDIEQGLMLPEDLIPLQWGDLSMGVAGMGPEASFTVGEKAVVFARMSECTVARKGLPPRSIPCLRPALGPYGIFDDLLPTVRGNFQAFGEYELFTDEVPAMVAQWPRDERVAPPYGSESPIRLPSKGR